MYDDVIDIYGPYQSKTDRRFRIILTFKDGHRRLMSYPKYLMEKYLNRNLNEDETVDHIDQDVTNNDISNLRVLTRSEHCSNDAIRNCDITVKCTYCGKEFVVPGCSIRNRNRKDRKQSGYFCSRKCSGEYGSDIQNGRLQPKIIDQVVIHKYTKHNFESAQEETLEVELP